VRKKTGIAVRAEEDEEEEEIVEVIACGWSVSTEPKLRLKRGIRSGSNEKREQEG